MKIWLLVLFLSEAVYAHHAFDAEFDVKAPVKLRGKVTKVELINPHSWIHLRVGKQDWMIECGSPNMLFRAGLKKDFLKAGTEILVQGFQSRDKDCKPACKANGRDVTFVDGKRIFLGSQGPQGS